MRNGKTCLSVRLFVRFVCLSDQPFVCLFVRSSVCSNNFFILVLSSFFFLLFLFLLFFLILRHLIVAVIVSVVIVVVVILVLVFVVFFLFLLLLFFFFLLVPFFASGGSGVEATAAGSHSNRVSYVTLIDATFNDNGIRRRFRLRALTGVAMTTLITMKLDHENNENDDDNAYDDHDDKAANVTVWDAVRERQTRDME